MTLPPLAIGGIVPAVLLGHTAFVNGRARQTGHLFQPRFGSVVMDEAYLIAAARYVPLNPVRARLVKQAVEWPWSSVRAQLAAKDDGLVAVRPLLERIGRVADNPGDKAGNIAPGEFAALRAAETIGRPLGDERFMVQIEAILGRNVRPGKRGRKPAVGRTGKE